VVSLGADNKLSEFLREQGYSVLPLPGEKCEVVLLVNTTPHRVNIVDDVGRVKYSIPRAVNPLRLMEVTEELTPIADIPRVQKKLDESQGLPPRSEKVFYIVPLAVAQAVRRTDFLVPDSMVNNSKGRILGCRRLAMVVGSK